MPEENKNQTTQPHEPITFLAETNFRNSRVKFGIKQDDRRRHMYIIGKTGMGKSTVMENMILQDIVNGHGVALVDPHGDFAEKIIKYIPASRINDIVYFNPADIEFPIAFNVMEAVSQEHKHLIASGLVGVFKKLWADSWGPRLEYILRNVILALLDYPGSTLLGINRMFVDKTFRNKVIAKIKDPVVKAFWVDEFARFTPQFAVEAVAPIQNKIGQFLSTALIRNVVGQIKSTISLREIMDDQKILIMNLSKGRIGEDASALLGAMMITKIQLAAMSRIDIPEKDRKDFYLYVDEFQNFATESFAAILSEARKYRLDLIIAHQYIEQLDETVSAAVFGNVGTIMCFRVGSADAEFLVNEFAPYFTAEDLVNLAKYEIYLKLMIDGVASMPFSANTLGPIDLSDLPMVPPEKVIRVSRERYTKPREVVEDKISRWSGMTDGDGDDDDDEEGEVKPKAAPQLQKPSTQLPHSTDNFKPKPHSGGMGEKPSFKKSSAPKRADDHSDDKNKKIYKVICYECGKPTEINFKPDGVRPVYCQSCFQKMREQGLRKGDNPIQQYKDPEPEKEEPVLSLSKALEQGPVNFSGKKLPPQEQEDKKQATATIKTVPQVAAPAPQKATQSTQVDIKTIQPGQEITF